MQQTTVREKATASAYADVTGPAYADAAGDERAAQGPVNADEDQPSDGFTTVRFVLEQLSAWGVKRIYGVIGDGVLDVLDGLARQNDIQYIQCQHEGAAALMASAEAKLTGRLAVCMATSGPGTANLVNGLADAASDRASVVAITGQVETGKIGTRTKQYINQQQLVQAVAMRSEQLASPDALPELLPELLKEAALNGAVTHLTVPKNMWQQQVDGRVTPHGEHLRQPLYAPPEAADTVARMIGGARRPALYVGGGAFGTPVVELAERIGAAVVTTLPARPLVPNGHELYAGGLGQAGSEASGVLLAEADLIVMLGATWWPDDYAPVQAEIVQIDKSPAAIGGRHPLRRGVVADLRDFVPQLLALLGGQPDRTDWRRRISAVARDWKRRIESEAAQDGTPVPPQRVMREIAEAAAEDAIIALDTGDHTLWFDRIFQTKPGQRVLVSGRWRTLGFGIPAAVAAQLEYPGRQTIAIVGDGGVLQTLMEFATAVAHGLPIVVVVLNNGCYAMERNRMFVGGLDALGSGLPPVDYAAVAEACGGVGYRAATADKLRQCLSRAAAVRRPALIDVITAAAIVPHTKI